MRRFRMSLTNVMRACISSDDNSGVLSTLFVALWKCKQDLVTVDQPERGGQSPITCQHRFTCVPDALDALRSTMDPVKHLQEVVVRALLLSMSSGSLTMTNNWNCIRHRDISKHIP